MFSALRGESNKSFVPSNERIHFYGLRCCGTTRRPVFCGDVGCLCVVRNLFLPDGLYSASLRLAPSPVTRATLQNSSLLLLLVPDRAEEQAGCRGNWGEDLGGERLCGPAKKTNLCRAEEDSRTRLAYRTGFRDKTLVE